MNQRSIVLVTGLGLGTACAQGEAPEQAPVEELPEASAPVEDAVAEPSLLEREALEGPRNPPMSGNTVLTMTRGTSRVLAGQIDLLSGDPEDIKGALRHRYRYRVGQCYETLLEAEPGISGRLAVTIELRDGHPEASLLYDTVGAQQSLSRCVLDEVAGWSFAGDSNGSFRLVGTFSPVEP